MGNPNRSNHALHVLSMLGRMPRHIVHHHQVPELQAFVLHCLCGPSCFNVSRAAYLLNNKDFDQLQGVAGFLQSEHAASSEDIGEIESFVPFLRNSEYHRHVSHFERPSILKNDNSLEDAVKDIADSLGFQGFTLCSWKTRFDNDGILLLEGTSGLDQDTQGILNDALCLVALCPTY